MFRRRRPTEAETEVVEAGDGPSPAADRPTGPWDRDEVDVPEDDDTRVDLGALLVTPVEGLDLQLQVDEGSGQVVAVVLGGGESAVELRPFAAPRHDDIWPDLRHQIAAEVARLGGTATETEGVWGTELTVRLTVPLPEGGHGEQPSRVVGVTGPRWLLRATFFGRAATDPDEDGDVERAMRDVVVVRGQAAIPPGEPLPVTVPESVRPTPDQ